jgi:hypothetical protein
MAGKMRVENMPKKTKIQHVKTFIKVSIITSVLVAFIVLGFFVRPNHSFENANMKKWSKLTPEQQIETVERIIKTSENQELLINCITKISELPDAEDMQIRDAIALCYNGILLNTESNQAQ